MTQVQSTRSQWWRAAWQAFQRLAIQRHDGAFSVGQRLGHAAAFAALAWTIRQERRSLSLLTREQRIDMGLSQAQIVVELNRPFFDIPANRLRRAVHKTDRTSRAGTRPFPK